MKRLLALVLLIAFGGVAFAQVPLPRADAAAPQANATQILVMLRMPPPHHRQRASYGGSYGDTGSRTVRQRIAQRIARDNGFTLVDGWPMPLLGVDCFVMQLPKGMSEAEAIARAERDRNVAWSQPMQQFRSMGTPQNRSDPLYAAQPAALGWRLADLHKVATGHGVAVAVIDSRVQTDHPDLVGQFDVSMDFVGGHGTQAEIHGTGIAGVIGARQGNGVGIVGVAPGARMMALRACWQAAGSAATVCDSLSLARALQYSIEHRAQVMNLSLSGPQDRLLAQLIEVALGRGISVVAAFDPKLPRGGFPASQPGVVAVSDQALPSLPPLVYVAPGRDVPTTQPGGKWYLADGSSYAAAHVSGLLALMRERREPTKFVTDGRRSIDACASLLPSAPGCDCDCALSALAGHARRR